MKTIHIVICSLFVTMLLRGLSNAATNKPSFTISGPDIVTKSFPCIFKISAEGPISMPKVTLYEETAPLAVKMKDVHTGELYIIASSRGSDIIVTTREGERLDGIAERRWEISVTKGQQRSDLIDLGLLRPEFGLGTVLSDVPPGEYEVTAEFPLSQARSNTIKVRLARPTVEEQQVLDEILSRGSFMRGKVVLWNRILSSGVRFSREQWDRLSPVTKAQTAFHILLADLFTPDRNLGPADENAVTTATIPTFLEPERECLLYEVKAATDKGDEAAASKLVNRYPDLAWRLQEVKASGHNFLSPRKHP